jgi:predicted ATPase/class 3 adenylate cyclase
LPPPIRAQLLLAPGASEHRRIAVAFVQFSGTDGLLKSAGPDATAAALDECVRNIQHACADHDVTFLESDINRDGGKIMLVAGAPRSSRHDEERMLRAVREIVGRAGTLPLRAGVNRGGVFSGDFGPDFRRTYSVKGDAVNLAARVMAKAALGQVLATRSVVAASQTAFRYQALPPFTVKGKSRPVEAVAVGAVDTAPPEEHAVQGDLVGRRHELTVLTTALDRVRHGHGSLIELVGEPGMGKSRLIDEVRRRAADLRVVDGLIGSYHSSTAYYPFRSLLRRLLGTASADDHSAASRLADRVDASAPQLLPWLPLLGVVLDLELPPTRESAELDEQFRAAKVADVTVEFLCRLLPAPTLLIFDNVHLVDDASTDLLRRLAEEVARRSWMLLVTRSDRPTGFVPDPSITAERLVLGPIDEAAALELIASTEQAARLGPQAMSVISRKAAGNPLFLHELVVAASRSGSAADLPDSVEAVVTSRIDLLDPGDRTLLRYAAVLGNRFALADLQRMLGRHLGRDALRNTAGLLEPDGDGRMKFRHVVIRDVAYAGLPYRLRRQMHHQVGQALERTGANREDLADQLALHYFHAGQHEKAWTYLRAAGARARARYAQIDAMEFFERALECTRGVREIVPTQIAEVYEQLGDVRDMAGLSTEAADAYRRGRRFATGDPVFVARLIFKEGGIALRLGRFSTSLRLLSRGRTVLDQAPDAAAEATRSRLASRSGFCKYLQGKYREAMRWTAIGAEEARRADDREALAFAYNVMHLAYLHARRAEEQPFGELALAIYEELGDLQMQGHCLNNLAISAMQDGRWELSSDLLNRAADLFRRVGDTVNEANAVYNRADLLIRQGRFAEVEPLLAAALRVARAADDHELVALVQREQGRALCGLGRWNEAWEQFDDAREGLAHLDLPQELIALDGAVAECLLLSGRIEEAAVVVADALARARALRATALIAPLLRIQGFGLLAARRFSEARSLLEAGLPEADGTDGQYERALMMLALAHIPGEQHSEELHRRSREILSRLAVAEVPIATVLTGA